MTTQTERGISHDTELLDNYDPEASNAIATECPGCQGVIVIFSSGEVAQPRTQPLEPGELIGGLLDTAFEKHHCPARPGQYACKNCGGRSDDESEAARCCSGPYNDSDYVKVKNAAPLE